MSDIDPQLLAKAADPATPQEELRQLAGNADLHPILAKNPNAYPGLLDWLVSKNDPVVMQALRERQQMAAQNPAIPMPTQPLPSAAPETNPAPAADSAAPQGLPQNQAQEPQPGSAPGTSGVSPYGETLGGTSGGTSGETPGQMPSETPANASHQPKRTSILAADSADTTVMPAAATQSTPVASASYPNPTLTTSEIPVAGGYAATQPGMAGYQGPNMPGYNSGMSAAPVPSTPNAKGSSNTALWVVFSFLMLILVALIVVIVIVLLRGGSLGGSEAQGGADDSSANSTQSTESSFDTTAFTTKSGSTSCRIGMDVLECNVTNLVSPLADDCPDGTVKVKLEGGLAESWCEGAGDFENYGGETPEYSDAISFGDFTCTSLSDGTKCMNQSSGEGFFIARQKFERL